MSVRRTIPATQPSSRIVQQHLFSLLQRCTSIENLTQIHTQIIIKGYTQKNHTIVKLLSLLVNYGYLHHAQQIFKRVENPSTSAWNQMIKGYSRSEKPHISIEFYNQMEAANQALPDGYTYSYVIAACAKGELLREGEQVHARVLSNGSYSNVFVQTNLVNLYSMFGKELGIGVARRVFDEMPERNVVSWNSLLVGFLRVRDSDGAGRVFEEMPERNVVSYTTMISGYGKNGKCKLALSLFREMKRNRVELDQVTLLNALSACAEVGDLKQGRWIHKYINQTFRARNQPLKVPLNNALVHMYASCGVIEDAYGVFKSMPQRNTISWTIMIIGFAKQGGGEEALSVFKWMHCSQENDAIPDAVTLMGVLCACSHSGFVDEGRHFFKCMKGTWGIEPRIEHYGCMVDLLSRAGFLDEAYGLVETMPMKPNDAVWGALLGGCRIHKNVKLASRVARKLVVELDPNKAAGYLVLLANIYATAKSWHNVKIVREQMVELGIRKPPGRSWVQIDGFIHDFLAGDRTHKHASSVYKTLAEITKQAKWEGKLDISEGPLNIEELNRQSKEVGSHSSSLCILTCEY